MGLSLFVPTVLGRCATSERTRCCCSIACVSASAVVCSRKILSGVLWDTLSVAPPKIVDIHSEVFGPHFIMKTAYGLHF